MTPPNAPRLRPTLWLVLLLAALAARCSSRRIRGPGPQCDPSAAIGGRADRVLGQALGTRVAAGTTVGARDDVTPSCVDTQAEDVTYHWTAPAEGTYVFDAEGTGFDVVLDVLDACSGRALGCSGVRRGAPGARVEATLMEGQEVVVVVDGAGRSAGPFVLNVHRTDATDAGADVPEDVPRFCPEGELGSALGEPVVRGTTAGRGNALASRCDPRPLDDAAFVWTAPETGTYRFDTRGSETDAVLVVIVGGCIGRELACDNGAARGEPASITLSLARGELLVLGVETVDPTRPFALNIVRLEEADADAGADALDDAADDASDAGADTMDAADDVADAGTDAGMDAGVDAADAGMDAGADAADAPDAADVGCPPGQTDCGGTCVDLRTDPRHCGMCGRACPTTVPLCIAGTCAP